MKTVSTKLDNSDFKRFQDMCNDDGMCASEELRDLIKGNLEAYEEYLDSENKKESEPKEESKITISEVEEKPKVISHGRILDDDGNVISPF